MVLLWWCWLLLLLAIFNRSCSYFSDFHNMPHDLCVIIFISDLQRLHSILTAGRTFMRCGCVAFFFMWPFVPSAPSWYIFFDRFVGPNSWDVLFIGEGCACMPRLSWFPSVLHGVWSYKKKSLRQSGGRCSRRPCVITSSGQKWRQCVLLCCRVWWGHF